MSERPRRGTANERIGQQAVDLAVARKERDDLIDALRGILGSEVYADAEGMLSIEHGGHDDTEHREIVAKARAAIERVEGT